MFLQSLSTIFEAGGSVLGILFLAVCAVGLMAMMAEATLQNADFGLEDTAAEALSSGEIQQLGDGRAAVYQGLNAAASGDTVSFATCGQFKVTSASATTFAKGDPVYWDASASLAINPSLTMDGSADFFLGTCAKAKANGDTDVLVDLNVLPRDVETLKPFVYEFDCETGVDTAEHVLIPAWMNKRGLVLELAYAIVTEVFAGTEDQGIVTVEDEDDNALSTLTASDAGADVVGDMIIGTNPIYGGSTGNAAKTVPAGKAVQAYVSQVTTGAAAGKMKVYLVVRPLV